MSNNIAFVFGNGESRNGIKIEDLKKAQWYLDRLVKEVE